MSPTRTFFHQALTASTGIKSGASSGVCSSISRAARFERGSFENHCTAMDASTTTGVSTERRSRTAVAVRADRRYLTESGLAGRGRRRVSGSAADEHGWPPRACRSPVG